MALGKNARGRPDAPLPAKALGTGPCPHAPLRYRAFPGAPDRRQDVVPADRHAADVVQARVIRFTHDRIDRADRFVAQLRQRIGHDRLKSGADGQCVGQDDRRLDRPQLLDLCRAGELSEGVAHKHGAGDLLLEEIAAVGEDGRHAGVDLIPLVDGRLPDSNATDVGDGIQRPGWEDARRDTQVTRSRPALVTLANARCGKQHDEQSHRERRREPVAQESPPFGGLSLSVRSLATMSCAARGRASRRALARMAARRSRSSSRRSIL